MDGELGPSGAFVEHFDFSGTDERAHPSEILLGVRGVEADEEFRFRETVDDEVIDAAAVGLAHQRVAGGAGFQRRQLIRHDTVEERGGIAAADARFAHVRDVEEPRRLANGHVFFDDTRVLHGHLPAGERD